MPGRFAPVRRFADPEKAARRLLEHARAIKPAPRGWIDVEQLNHPFLFTDKAKPIEYRAGMEFAISEGWLELHESDAFVRFTPLGAAILTVEINVPSHF
jgi:hypothetical protein